MIQRVQSLFLLAIAVIMICFLFYPVWQKQAPQADKKVILSAFNMTTFENGKESAQSNTIYIAVLAIASALTAGYSLFRYDNRLTQMKLGLLNSLIMVMTMLGLVILARQGDKIIAEGEGKLEIGFFLIFIAVFCNLLSNRFIKRDENLVKSADRLR